MIIPTDDMIEEIASPQNKLNPPFAETLAKLKGLLTIIKAIVVLRLIGAYLGFSCYSRK